MASLISLLVIAGFAVLGECGKMAMNGYTLQEAESGYRTQYHSFTEPRGGTIDSETVNLFLSKNNATHCFLWCTEPMAMYWKPVSQNYYVDSIELIETCAVVNKISLMSKYGFYCFNANQEQMNCALPSKHADYDDYCMANKLNLADMNKNQRDHHMLCDLCPDFEVAFVCPDPKPQHPSQCPKSTSKRNEDQLRELDEEMKYIQAAKQDIKQRMLEEEKRERQKKSNAENSLLRLIKEYLNKQA